MAPPETEIVVEDPTAPETNSPAVTSVRVVDVVVSLVLLALAGMLMLWGVQRSVASRLSPDPVTVAMEMVRVCRPGGRVIILNHFLSQGRLLSRIERWISPATIHIGFKSDLDLPAFLTQANLQPKSIEKVNLPPIWSLITVVKQ